MANQLHRRLRAVRLRLQWIEFCRRFLRVTAVVALFLFIYVVVSRLIILPLNLNVALPWIEAVAALALIVWVWLKRVKLFDAAVRADESLGLKERLSSALLIGEPKSEPELAVIEDATKAAVGIRPSRSFPMNLGRELKIVTPPLVALVLAWWLMPQLDLLAKTKEEKKKSLVAVEAKREAAKKLDELAREIGEPSEIKKPAIAEDIQHDLTSLAKLLTDQKVGQDQAMAKLDNMSEKLERRKEELEKSLPKSGGLQSKGEGKWTGDLQKAIEEGNYSQAAKLAKDLQEKLKSGKLSQAEKEALQKELKMLAEKLAENSTQADKQAKAGEKAGEKAGDKAGEKSSQGKSGNGSKQGQNSSLAEALAKAGEKMSQGEFNGAIADLEMAEKDLMSMEQMLAEMKSIEGLKDELNAHKMGMNGKPQLCQSCGKPSFGALCLACMGAGVGEWKPGETDNEGGGMGGPGKGRGGVARKQEGQVGFKQTKVKGNLDAGKIIGKLKVNGTQSPGEITTQYEQLRLEYAQKAEDTIHNETLPMEFKTYVRDYFDAIKRGKADGAAQDQKQP